MSSAKNTMSTTSCDICGKTFQNLQSARIHRNVHTKKPKYKCAYCNRMFRQLQSYKAHVMSEHNKEREANTTSTTDGENNKVEVPKLFKCPGCERKFESKAGMMIHKGIVHVGGLTNRSYLKPRVTSRGNREALYQCRICKAVFTSLKCYRNHKQTHGKAFRCEVCNVHFYEKSDQVNHLKKHKLYKCLFCEKTFTSEQKLRKHMKENHQNDVIKFLTCKICNRCFDNEDQHGLHMIKIHWNKRNSEKKMRKHMNEKTEKSNDNTEEADRSADEINGNYLEKNKRFNCDTCGASFSSRFYLKTHINLKHFDGTLLQDNEQEIRETELVDKITGSTKRNTFLNRRILEDFEVDNEKLSSLVDPESQTRYYICKVCLTTHVSMVRFIYHIQSNASDHDIYLKRKIYYSDRYPYVIPKEPSNNFNSSLQQRLKYNNNKLRKDTRTSENVCKVIDVRSIGTDVNQINPPSDTVKPELKNSTTYISAENNSNSNNNVDESTIINTTDEVDSNDMQPLYTARPLLPQSYIFEEFEHYGNTTFEVDDIADVTDINNTDKSDEDDTNIHSENGFESTTTPPLSHLNIMEKEETNLYISNSTSKRCFVTAMDTKTANKSRISSQNQILETSDHSNELADISFASPQLSFTASISKCIQCKTLRELSSKEQSYLRCCLCHYEFCANCSGLPAEIYQVLLRCKTEYSSGLIWSCESCKSLLPKLSKLASNLRSFDQHINSRLTKIEDRMSSIKDNFNINPKQPHCT